MLLVFAVRTFYNLCFPSIIYANNKIKPLYFTYTFVVRNVYCSGIGGRFWQHVLHC